MQRLRIGIVGCGEVAQIIHIPALMQLRDQFEITALCDISAKVVDGVAVQCGGSVKQLDKYHDLVADDDVDAVLITNPHVYHAEVAIAALGAGKHVFIEKPMCMSLAEADALVEAERAAGKIVQIGFMRRYAPAFLQAKELVGTLKGTIKTARVYDIIGRNAQIVGDTSNVIRDPDISEAAREEMMARESAAYLEAIGVDSGDLKNSYAIMLGLSSHDISAMRELLGRPKSVLHASSRGEGRVMTALFDYGDFVCEFVTALDDMARYDTYLQVNAAEAVVRVDYDTPYVRNLPAKLTVTRPDTKHGVATTVSFPGRTDSFVLEWMAFYDSVAKGAPLKTTIADAREDIEIFLDIVEHLRAAK